MNTDLLADIIKMALTGLMLAGWIVMGWFIDPVLKDSYVTIMGMLFIIFVFLIYVVVKGDIKERWDNGR